MLVNLVIRVTGNFLFQLSFHFGLRQHRPVNLFRYNFGWRFVLSKQKWEREFHLSPLKEFWNSNRKYCSYAQHVPGSGASALQQKA